MSCIIYCFMVRRLLCLCVLQIVPADPTDKKSLRGLVAGPPPMLQIVGLGTN